MPRIGVKRATFRALGAGLVLLGTSLLAQDSQSSAPDQPKESRARRLQKLLNPDQAERTANAGQPADIPNPAPVNPGTPPGMSAPPPPSVPYVPPQPAMPTPVAPAPLAPTPAAPATALPAEGGPATVAPSAATISAAISKQPPAAVKNVQIVHDKAGPAIEILTSRPVPPALQTLPTPPRLVIDLPNANVAVKQSKMTGAQGGQFTSLRVDQFQVTPPVARVTVDLIAANQYTWDAAGNRLMIRLKPTEPPKPQPAAPAQPTTVSTFGSGSKAAVVPVTTSGSGSMVLAGSRIGNGSSVTATAETAVLHIARGGEVHVCPGTTVSVTASKTGQELMLGMSSGSLETHYHVGASSDTVLTPDFRIQLAGPGDFDYAISSNSHGDTCVRALLGNASSAIVTELMGDRTYQVKPTEQVVFHEGRIDRISNDVSPDCGCPGSPRPAMMLASTSPNPPISDAGTSSNVQLASGAAPGFRASIDPMLGPMPSSARSGMGAPSGSQVNLASMSPETAPLPPAKPNDIHVQIVAPFTFRGTDPAPAPVTRAQNLPVKPATTNQAKLDPAVLPPPSVPAPQPPDAMNADPPKKQHRGFLGRVKGFFSGAFK